MPTSNDRIEAQAIKAQLEQVIRLLLGKHGSPLSTLLREINAQTRKRVNLTVSAGFLNESSLAQHDPPFIDYDASLETALYKCADIAEYNSWRIRRDQLRGTCEDFQIRTIMVEETLEPAIQSSGPEAHANTNGLSSNDRRFLKSLRIASEFLPDKSN